MIFDCDRPLYLYLDILFKCALYLYFIHLTKIKNADRAKTNIGSVLVVTGTAPARRCAQRYADHALSRAPTTHTPCAARRLLLAHIHAHYRRRCIVTGWHHRIINARPGIAASFSNKNIASLAMVGLVGTAGTCRKLDSGVEPLPVVCPLAINHLHTAVAWLYRDHQRLDLPT